MRISDWSSDVCSSDLGHRQLTRKTLINITKQLTAIIIRCKENHCMNDFSGLCLNRSFNFTGCKDSIGQSHTRHRHRTEDYIDSQVLNLMMTVIEGVSLTRSEEHTSELQSLMRISYAVFGLKKKTKNKYNNS